jgi:Rps23 Pro-64 3,4-dihydroxylase Tpa1-like proline 4-hydroxylase
MAGGGGAVVADEADRVTVTLLLGGGHRSTVTLRRQDPALRALIGALQAKSAGQPPVAAGRPFHLRIEEGRQSLVFAPGDLVGLITDPPLAVEAPPAAAPPAAAATAADGSQQPVVKSRYVIAENFLPPADHAALLRFAIDSKERFVDSSVSTDDADYRRSKVLYDFPSFAELFRRRIRELMPQLLPALQIAPFPAGDIECQMTAHNDGNFYKLHNDNGSPDTATRALTYVYYFHNEPKAYDGGALRIYDSVVADGFYRCGPHAADVEPKNNSVIFFVPHTHHEVLPVRCPSKRFEDGRFTVNGWVRRAASA